MGKNRRRWILFGIVGLAFALRALGLGAQSLWRDEVDAIRFAAEPLADLIHLFVEPGQNGPLYYLLLRPWLALAGRGEFALRFFSLFFGVLAVPLSYRLARRLFPRLPSLALLAALLAATSPYLVWYSQEGKMYALVVCLVLLSMERYLAALDEGGWQRWLVYVLATSAIFYVHLIGVLMLPVQVIAFFLQDREVRRARWKPWLASLAVLTLPYLPLLAWQVPMLLTPGETGFRFAPLHELVLSLLASQSLGVVQTGAWWLALVPFVVLLFGSGLLAAESRSNARSRLAWQAVPGLVLAAWLVVPVVGLFLVTLSRPLYTARYLIFVLPAFLLLLAAGSVAVARRSRLLATVLVVAVLAINAWGLWQQARTPLKADFRSASRYLAEHMGPDDLVLFQIPYGRHSFDYYYLQALPGPGTRPGSGAYRVFLPWIGGGGGRPYRWAEGLYTNGGMGPDAVERRMAEVTRGSRVVWLVATEVELWDERGLVQNWLERHGVRTDEAEFVRVQVYGYELP